MAYQQVTNFVLNLGDVAGRVDVRVKAGTTRPAGLIGSGILTIPGVNTTPVAPVFTANDTADTFTLSHPTLGTSEILISENNGPYVAYTGEVSVGNVPKAEGYWKAKTRADAAANRNESPVANSPAFTESVITTPEAPTVTADDVANTLIFSHALGSSEIVVSENNGPYNPYTGTIMVGNIERAAGYWKAKIKAATGRNESLVTNSPAFTATSIDSNLRVLLEPNQFALSGSDITEWHNTSGIPNHFAKPAAASSYPQKNSSGHAVFGAGDCLVSNEPLTSGALSQLSCVVTLKCDTPSVITNQFIVGSIITETTKRSFGIYNIPDAGGGTAGYHLFMVSSNGGTPGSSNSKIHRLPYTTDRKTIGFTFNGGIFKIYLNGVLQTIPSSNKVYDAVFTSVFANNLPMTIGNLMSGTGQLNTAYVSLEGTIEKIRIETRELTAAEMAL